MTATRPSAAQARIMRRLADGEVIYAWNGVSRTTAYAMIRDGLAQWAVEPHVVRVRSDTPGSKVRHQLEWGLMARPCPLHADCMSYLSTDACDYRSGRLTYVQAEAQADDQSGYPPGWYEIHTDND